MAPIKLDTKDNFMNNMDVALFLLAFNSLNNKFKSGNLMITIKKCDPASIDPIRMRHNPEELV